MPALAPSASSGTHAVTAPPTWSDLQISSPLETYVMSHLGLALAGCIFLLVAAAFFRRRIFIRMTKRQDGTNFRLLESVRLGPHGTLYLVGCADRTLVVAADARGIGAVRSVESIAVLSPNVSEGE